MPRSAGFIIDVPVTLSVAVRGTSKAEAIRIAREFAEALDPSTYYTSAYSETLASMTPGVSITEATLEASAEDEAEVLEDLEADDQNDEDSQVETCSHEDETGVRCGKPLDDGEGYDGLCGEHADQADNEEDAEHADDDEYVPTNYFNAEGVRTHSL